MARPKNFDKPSQKGCIALALEIGQSVTTVSRKMRQGKTPDQIRLEAQVWNAKQAAHQDDGEPGDGETFVAAQLRKEIATADLNELKVAKGRGEVVDIAEINAYVSGMIIRSRDILLRIGPELRDRLAAESDPIRIQALIDGEVYRALGVLSEYRPQAA